MGNERSSVGASGGMLEDWGVNLDEAMLIHEVTRGLPEDTATDKALANFWIHIHINIASAITLFFISKTIATRERTEWFCE